MVRMLRCDASANSASAHGRVASVTCAPGSTPVDRIAIAPLPMHGGSLVVARVSSGGRLRVGQQAG